MRCDATRLFRIRVSYDPRSHHINQTLGFRNPMRMRSHAHLQALPTLERESRVRVIAFFDHEECGSASAHGAASDAVSKATKHCCHCLQFASRATLTHCSQSDSVAA